MLSELEERIMDKWNKANVRKGDVITVMFKMKVESVSSGSIDTAQIFGFTEDGMCVSSPLNAVMEPEDGR